LKVLIVRFSSIGDIVLTTPVVRCLKQQVDNIEIHYLTKNNFISVIENNPYIDKIHTIGNDLKSLNPLLKQENFDLIVDLHHNVRTLKLKYVLGKKSVSFNKLNWKKFLITTFKINTLPKQHIVDRYLETIKFLGVLNDNKGLDYFISNKDEVELGPIFPAHFLNGYYALVIGGSYFTKQIPLNKLKEICAKSTLPLVLLGGKEDASTAETLHNLFPIQTLNVCGKMRLNQSASIIKQSKKVITSDTGLMHIAAAYKKDIISIWGNTIPEFGMGPYMSGNDSQVIEIKNLSCRPCSKLGYKKCPKGHFKCMNDIDVNTINNL
jgi:ADP-heptose:LPS heptosyltransferase